MVSAERQLIRSAIETSGERVLDNAQVLASKNNSNIGIAELFEGIKSEIGTYLVNSDLHRKGVHIGKLNEDLELLRYSGDGVKPPPQSEVGLSSSAKTVIEYALNLARSRKNPIAQRVNARDLLAGIAAVSHDEAGKVALAYFRSLPSPDPQKREESFRRQKRIISFKNSFKKRDPSRDKISFIKIDKPLPLEI